MLEEATRGDTGIEFAPGVLRPELAQRTLGGCRIALPLGGRASRNENEVLSPWIGSVWIILASVAALLGLAILLRMPLA